MSPEGSRFEELILFNAETGLLKKRLERAALEGEGWRSASTNWVAPAKGARGMASQPLRAL
jgi:hypothetical protein